MSGLRAMGGDVEAALEAVNVPSYVIDSTGVVRWINQAAFKIVGDVRGQQFTSVCAPEDRRRARELFAQKIAGTAPVTNAEVVLFDQHGDRLVAEVLRLLERGYSTRQIANELHLSLDTVRNHVRGLLRALGVRSRLEAVALARQTALVAE